MKGHILVVDDERAIGIAIQRLLMGQGHGVDAVQSGEDAIARLERDRYDLVITDLSLGSMTGMDVLRRVRELAPDTAVVMITAYGSERTAVEAMKLGAADYLAKPFDNDEMVLVVERVLEGLAVRRDLHSLREQVASAHRFENLIGRSAPMQRVFDVIRKVAATDLTVLVSGPSGTGKELVASAVHYNSPRRAKPFVKVNCAAFSRELVESELFGHERGAFTGAVTTRAGKFEAADGGTLFLDEVGDMPLETQAKMLRVLQEQEFERVGGNRVLKVDVRVVAATNQDLAAKVAAGGFREDLFYRLNVVALRLPALSERPEDVPLLVEHFLDKVATRLGRPRPRLAPEAFRALLANPWRGNVRELEHAIEQAVVLASGETIGLTDFPLLAAGVPAAPVASGDTPASFKEAKQRLVEQFERDFITQALERHHGNISRAAEDMDMYRQQLQQKLAEYGIDADAFRQRGERS